MRRTRKGVATAEFALCLPVLMLVCFGTIEACASIYLKQSLSIAAYEGVRCANVAGASNQDVAAACNRIFADRGILGTRVTTVPENISTAVFGQFIAVECTADSGVNMATPWVFAGQDLQGRAEAMKKY